MNLAEDTVIVTGASGFLGSAVVRETANQGIPAIGIVRRLRRNQSLHAFVVTDLLQSSDRLMLAIAESRATILVHCALPDRESFTERPDAADVRTEQIDSNVIRACAEPSSSISRVVLVSSSAVYGSLNPSENAFPEMRLPNPVNQYGRTKLAQEKRWTAALGARLAIARVFNVTGPGEPTSMVAGSLAHRIANASPQTALSLHNSQSVRDFSDVRDVAKAVLSISRLGTTAPRCFNVCSGVGTTILELANLIVVASGREIKIKQDGMGSESRSIGDAQLIRNTTGWGATFRLEESASALWNFRSNVSRGAVDPSFR